MSTQVKIFFEYVNSTQGSIETESMWATKTPSGFQLDNIPFYVQGVSIGDVVSARTDLDGILWFDSLVEPSRHSTVRLWFANKDDVLRVRSKLRELGCPSELSELPRLVAVDIPPTVSYDSIRRIFDDYEHAGVLEFEESCLGNK